METYTLRHSPREESLPIRRMEAFLPGEGMGGAANHWNGDTWRWAEYDPILRTRLESRYGKKAIPTDMPVQDWGITYAQMEPYHDLFERLFGLSGKAGNIKGVIQTGGDPFEAPRRGEYPQKPIEITEAGTIFKAAAESFGYKVFPCPAANSSGTYTNPDGMHLAPCQYWDTASVFFARRTRNRTMVPSSTLLLARLELRRSHVLGISFDRGQARTPVRFLRSADRPGIRAAHRRGSTRLHHDEYRCCSRTAS